MVERLHGKLKERGAKIDYELCDQSYGCREFGAQGLERDSSSGPLPG